MGFGAMMVLAVGAACPGLASTNPGAACALRKHVRGTSLLILAPSSFDEALGGTLYTAGCSRDSPRHSTHHCLIGSGTSCRVCMMSASGQRGQMNNSETDYVCGSKHAAFAGLQKLVMGAFGLPMGLLCVLVTGAELFTGNTMMLPLAVRPPLQALAELQMSASDPPYCQSASVLRQFAHNRLHKTESICWRASTAPAS